MSVPLLSDSKKIPETWGIQEMDNLRVEGERIVDGNGKTVILEGAGLGGHLNMENFITGFTGHEFEFRREMHRVLGKEKAEFFIDRLLEYFWTDSDAKFLASLGLNCLRIPINYRHFEDDSNPGVYKDEGFKKVDRIVETCAKHGIYTILDLHTAPGGQNQAWHCDSGIHKALFWEHKCFQDRFVKLWEALAAHYRGNTSVAGYNPLNEPGDEQHWRLQAFYTRIELAIRSVDPHHILFLDGNSYSTSRHFRGSFQIACTQFTIIAIMDFLKVTGISVNLNRKDIYGNPMTLNVNS